MKHLKIITFFLHRAKLGVIILVAVFSLSALPLISTSESQVYAVFNNSSIIPDRNTYPVGYPYYQKTNGDTQNCWQFVRDMLKQASGGIDIFIPSGNYFEHLEKSRGVRQDLSNLAPGDIVQEGPNGGHTYIIVSRIQGNNYNIVDSNAHNDGKVDWGTRTVTSPSSVKPEYGETRAYRFGNVGVGNTNLDAYVGKIVKWHNTNGSPDASWVVSGQRKRYWIPDGKTYSCLVKQGYSDAGTKPKEVLDQLQDQSGTNATCDGNILGTNRILFRNMYIKSSDGRYILILQTDGNLVVYDTTPPPPYLNQWRVLWANYRPSDFLIMQSDGNLVTYSYDRGPTWWTGTNSPKSPSSGWKKPTDLVMQTDGNLVLYAPGAYAIWGTKNGRIR